MQQVVIVIHLMLVLSLIGVVLLQRSEGGGLGVGGSSSGFMTARGAADFLTRATAVLGGLFIVLSIVMAAFAGATRQPTKIDTSLANSAAPFEAPKQAPPQQTASAPTQAPTSNTAQNQSAPAVPLAQ